MEQQEIIKVNLESMICDGLCSNLMICFIKTTTLRRLLIIDQEFQQWNLNMEIRLQTVHATWWRLTLPDE